MNSILHAINRTISIKHYACAAYLKDCLSILGRISLQASEYCRTSLSSQVALLGRMIPPSKNPRWPPRCVLTNIA